MTIDGTHKAAVIAAVILGSCTTWCAFLLLAIPGALDMLTRSIAA